MILGFPFSVPFGSHQDHIKSLVVRDLGSGLKVQFVPWYAQYYRLRVDGIQFPAQWCDVGVPAVLRAPYSSPDNIHTWSLCPTGDWGNDGIDCAAQEQQWQAGRMDRIRVTITAKPRIFSTGDAAQLTGWRTLSGLQRYSNCRPVNRRPTWAALDLTLTDSGGTRTVTLSNAGTVIMTGSRVGDGALTLTGDYGAQITVDVAYTADVTTGALLVVAYPVSYPVHRQAGVPFAASDFPRAAEGTVYDDGKAIVYTYRTPALASGLWYVLSHSKDECANESTGVGGTAVTVVARPKPPGTPVYSAGDHAATELIFENSDTAGCTFNVYDSKDTEHLSVEQVAKTHAGGVDTFLTLTLDAISDTFAGTRYVLIRSVKAGVESGNADILEIEYDGAGAVIKPRPPEPAVANIVTTNGLTLTVPIAIDRVHQAVAASQARLYVYAVGSAPSYGTPQGTVTVPAGSGIASLNVSATLLAPGAYMFAVRCYSAVNGVEDDNLYEYGPIYLTTAPMDDPTQEAGATT